MPERVADKLAPRGSFLDKLRARREAVEAGHPEMAEEAYRKGSWKDVSVDGAVDNEKSTYDDPDDKPHLRK